MHELMGSNLGLKRTGRPGHYRVDPLPCGIMTENTQTQERTDASLRAQFLAQFEDDQRRRTEKARTSVLQTTFSELSRRDWGGSR